MTKQTKVAGIITAVMFLLGLIVFVNLHKLSHSLITDLVFAVFIIFVTIWHPLCWFWGKSLEPFLSVIDGQIKFFSLLPGIEGKWENRKVKIWLIPESQYGTGTIWLIYLYHSFLFPSFQIFIRREDPGSTFRKRRVLKVVETGDSTFDTMCKVRTDNESQAKIFLTSLHKDVIRDIFCRHNTLGELVLDPAYIKVTYSGELSLSATVKILKDLVQLAK